MLTSPSAPPLLTAARGAPRDNLKWYDAVLRNASQCTLSCLTIDFNSVPWLVCLLVWFAMQIMLLLFYLYIYPVVRKPYEFMGIYIVRIGCIALSSTLMVCAAQTSLPNMVHRPLCLLVLCTTLATVVLAGLDVGTTWLYMRDTNVFD